eukprot:3938061-Rhodomonas_salina.1
MARGVTLSDTEPEQLFEKADYEITDLIGGLVKQVLEGSSFESWGMASTSVSKIITDTFLQIPVQLDITILHVVIPVTPLLVTAWKDSKETFVLNAGEVMVVQAPFVVKLKTLTEAQYWKVMMTNDGKQ